MKIVKKVIDDKYLYIQLYEFKNKREQNKVFARILKVFDDE